MINYWYKQICDKYKDMINVWAKKLSLFELFLITFIYLSVEHFIKYSLYMLSYIYTYYKQI